jgi:hypothetical protein
MMPQDGLAEQTVSQVIKSILAASFPVKTASLVSTFAKVRAVRDESSVEVHKFQE